MSMPSLSLNGWLCLIINLEHCFFLYTTTFSQLPHLALILLEPQLCISTLLSLITKYNWLRQINLYNKIKMNPALNLSYSIENNMRFIRHFALRSVTIDRRTLCSESGTVSRPRPSPWTSSRHNLSANRSTPYKYHIDHLEWLTNEKQQFFLV